MPALVYLLVHLFVAVLIFLLLYWGIVSLCAIIPSPGPPALPIQAIVRVFLILLLIVLAISFLTGEAGWWGDWGWAYHRGR
jgi:hypothetical protein